MENKSYIGYWYLPENKEDEVFGILNINSEEIKLELVGVFDGFDDLDLSHKKLTINGFSKCGKEITLLNCINTNFSFNAPGIPSKTYICDYVIVGNEYENLDTILIKEMECEFSGLDKWINIRPFERRINNTEKEYQINYKLPEAKHYNAEKLNISISFGSKMNVGNLNSIEIKQRVYVKFNFNEKIKLKEGLKNIDDFADFLTLCLGEEVKITSIVLKENKKMDLYYNGIEEGYESKIRQDKILIPFKLIEENLNEILIKWYQIKDDLRPIINYVIEAYEKVFHIPMTFLKIVQALETFSRRMRSNIKENEREYENKKKYILDSIDKEEYKKWLEDVLRYANEPKLNKRINEILLEMKFFLNLNSKKRSSLSQKITDTRNYYTHFDKFKEDKKMDANKIYYSTVILQLILRVLIMLELGISKDIIEKQVIECEQYKINKFYEVFEYNKNQ